MFDNYRCRLCGKFISMERRKPTSIFDHDADNSLGMIFKNNDHRCCTLLEDGEEVYCDHVSRSARPIERASEVFVLNKEGKYEPAKNTSECD